MRSKHSQSKRLLKLKSREVTKFLSDIHPHDVCEPWYDTKKRLTSSVGILAIAIGKKLHTKLKGKTPKTWT